METLQSFVFQILGLMGVLFVAALPVTLNDWFLRNRAKRRESRIDRCDSMIQEAYPNPRRVYLSFNFQILLFIAIVLAMVVLKNCVNEGARLSQAATRTEEVLRTGIRTDGELIDKTVTEIEGSSRSSYLHHLTVKFGTPDGRIIQGTRVITSLGSGIQSSNLKIGDRITVRYLSEKPEGFILPDYISFTDAQPNVGTSLILIFTGSLIVAFSLLYYVLRKSWMRARNWTILEGKILKKVTKNQKDDSILYEYRFDGTLYPGECAALTVREGEKRLILLINPKDPTQSVVHSVSQAVQIWGL